MGLYINHKFIIFFFSGVHSSVFYYLFSFCVYLLSYVVFLKTMFCDCIDKYTNLKTENEISFLKRYHSVDFICELK